MTLWEMLKASKGLPVSDPFAAMYGASRREAETEIAGAPPLDFRANGNPLKDYRIYGNTVQDGTPTPDNPVDVVGVGEYDTQAGQYKIPVTISNGVDSVTTPVYIGSEPLHKIGNYADYVDYATGKIVRNVGKKVFDGTEAFYKPIWSAAAFEYSDIRNRPSGGDEKNCFINAYEAMSYNESWSRHNYGVCVHQGLGVVFRDIRFPDYAYVNDFKSYLADQYAAGTPVTIWYVLATPIEEPLDTLPSIPTLPGTNTLTVGATVQPSNVYIKGKIKSV